MAFSVSSYPISTWHCVTGTLATISGDSRPETNVVAMQDFNVGNMYAVPSVEVVVDSRRLIYTANRMWIDG